MWLYFNNQGTLTTKISNGSVIRQANTFTLYIAFEKNNPDIAAISGSQTLPTLRFKSHGSNIWDDKEYLLERISDDANTSYYTFKRKYDSMTYDLVDGKQYIVYQYKGTPDILQNYGQYDLKITTRSNIDDDSDSVDVYAAGIATINVEKTFGDAKVKNYITESQYNYLMGKVSTLLSLDPSDFASYETLVTLAQSNKEGLEITKEIIDIIVNGGNIVDDDGEPVLDDDGNQVTTPGLIKIVENVNNSLYALVSDTTNSDGTVTTGPVKLNNKNIGKLTAIIKLIYGLVKTGDSDVDDEDGFDDDGNVIDIDKALLYISNSVSDNESNILNISQTIADNAEDIDNLELKADKLNDDIEIALGNAQTALDIASELSKPLVFDTESEMYTYISNAENKGKHHVGTVIYIKDPMSDDYWISAVYETADSNGYYYEITSLEKEKPKNIGYLYYRTSQSAFNEKPTSINSIGWSSEPVTPTQNNPYVFVSQYTQTGDEYEFSSPKLFSTLEGLVSILADPSGVNIISKDETSGQYILNADKINGAISDDVTIGGFTIHTEKALGEVISGAIYNKKQTDTSVPMSVNNNSDGVYIGNDGIKVGSNFKVDSKGVVTAVGLKINLTDQQKEDLKGEKGDTGAAGGQGPQGEPGIQGVQGVPGSDGKTYYTWLKYADTPTSGMSDQPDGKKYMGVAFNKETSTESTDYNDYKWSLIQGEKGDPGENGNNGNGIKEITYYYMRNTGDIPSADDIHWDVDISKAKPTILQKYSWQKEVIEFTNTTDKQVTILLLAVRGDNGNDATVTYDKIAEELGLDKEGSYLYMEDGVLVMSADAIKSGLLQVGNDDAIKFLASKDNNTVKIGGFDVTSSSLYSGTDSLTSNTSGVYLGTDGIKVVGEKTTKINSGGGIIASYITADRIYSCVPRKQISGTKVYTSVVTAEGQACHIYYGVTDKKIEADCWETIDLSTIFSAKIYGAVACLGPSDTIAGSPSNSKVNSTLAGYGGAAVYFSERTLYVGNDGTNSRTIYYIAIGD